MVTIIAIYRTSSTVPLPRTYLEDSSKKDKSQFGRGGVWITRTLILLYFFYMNYVYVLKSFVDEELYIGSTTDLKRRLREHDTKKSFSTSWRGPFELIYYEAYKNPQDAREREKSLKFRGNSRKHLKNRISRSLQ